MPGGSCPHENKTRLFLLGLSEVDLCRWGFCADIGRSLHLRADRVRPSRNGWDFGFRRFQQWEEMIRAQTFLKPVYRLCGRAVSEC